MIDLHKLRHFTAVARAGSFVRAAEELHLSQPALTKSIQALERSWGVTLFDRGRAGTTLTTAGRRMVGRAERLLDSASSLERTVLEPTADRVPAETASEVHFALGARLTTLVMPRLYAQAMRLHPDIRLQSTQATTAEMLEQLLEGRIEFALGLIEPPPTDRIAAEVLALVRPSLCVRASHPLTEAGPVRYADVARYRLISGFSFNEVLSRLPADDPRQVLRVSYEGEAYDVMAAVARDTDVVLVTMPGPDLEGLVELRAAPQEIRLPALPIGLYTLAARPLSPSAEAIADQVRVVLAGLVPEERQAEEAYG